MINIESDVKGLIFDLDGTLVDSMGLHYKVWCQIIAEAGIEYPKSMFYELAGMPESKTVQVVNERFGSHLDPNRAEALKQELFFKCIDQVQIIKPVVDVVFKYHGKLPMAVGTGSHMELAMKELEVTKLLPYFDVVISANDVSKHKPHPDTFLLCAEKMGVKPQDCLVFEDGELGIKAAKSAGMRVFDVRTLEL